MESYVENRRERRSEIRDRIERERRKALAPMRTRRLREWAEREDGEGLEEILLNSNHGLKVLEYDYPKVASTITGSTYVRLDDHRIVKINREIPFEPASGRAVATDPESSGGLEVADNNSNLPPPRHRLVCPRPLLHFDESMEKLNWWAPTFHHGRRSRHHRKNRNPD